MTTDRPILTADILSRQAVRSPRIVSSQDFNTGEWAENATADLSATARIITDEPERRRILEQVARVWRRTDVDEMVRFSPLIEVTVIDVDAVGKQGLCFQHTPPFQILNR